MALRVGRFRVLFLTAVTLAAASASLVIGNVLASRFHTRFDVTATGSQRLADRTMKVLRGLDGRYEAVVATDFSLADRRAKERLSDVLEEFRRGGTNFDYTLIDTSSATGMKSYKDLIRRLVGRDAEMIRHQTTMIEMNVGAATSLASYLNDVVSPKLLEIEGQIPPTNDAGKANRDYFTQEAARARLVASDITASVAKADESLRFKIEGEPIPQTDQAAAALAGALAATVEQLSNLAKELRRFGDGAENAGPGADSARGLVGEIQQRRDQAAVMLDSLRKLRRPDVLRIVEALRSGSAALVIGPPAAGLCALDMPTVLPSSAWLDATGAVKADQGRRIEELLSTAVSSLRIPHRPIVIMVHAEPREFLAEVPILTNLKQRLEFRGIDMVEWAVLVRPDPPRLGNLDPEGARPVVYACLSPDSSAPSPGRGQPTGVQRAEQLARVMDRLAGEGKNLIISLNPSVLPISGSPDPLEKVLARFALASETGRPLLREVTASGGRAVDTDLILQANEDSQQPVGAALRGLPTYFAWPIALVEKQITEDPARIVVSGLYSVPAGPNVWLESQWLDLWSTPRDHRGVMKDPPKFDEGRDSLWPSGADKGGAVQRWMVAAASERTMVGAPSQRAVVVGSNSWFIDAVTGRQTLVEGRRVPANPGNLEFFENAVYWLSGQAELIAQSPAAQAVPMISSIGEVQAKRLRLALIIGLPVLALLGGALMRLIRR